MGEQPSPATDLESAIVRLKGQATIWLPDEHGIGGSTSSDALETVRLRVLRDGCAPKELSGPYRANKGSFLIVDFSGLDRSERSQVASAVVGALGPLLLKAVFAGARGQQGPFARRRFTAEPSENVVLVLHPAFARPMVAEDATIPTGWIASLVRGLASLGWLDEAFDCLLGGIRYERVAAHGLADLLRSSIDAATSALVCTPSGVPVLRSSDAHRVAVAGPATTGLEAEEATRSLRALALNLPGLGYGYLDVTRGISPLVRDYYQPPDRPGLDTQGGEAFCDERIPDAFSWQLLNAGQVRALGDEAETLGLQSRGDLFECSIGEVGEWWEERAEDALVDPDDGPLPRPMHDLARRQLRRLLIRDGDEFARSYRKQRRSERFAWKHDG